MKTVFKKILSTIFFLGLFITAFYAQAANVRYVSDDLTIPMRSGTTTRHKILSFLNSGTKVTVIGSNEDGTYTQITADDDKEGWVETRYLMDNMSARDQLVITQKKLENSKDDIAKLKVSINELKNEKKQLEDERDQLSKDKASLENTLADLRESAAKPIALFEENQQLEAQLEELTNNHKKLQSENAMLSDSSLKEWFIIGAAVAIGSLILGLIIPSIRWRKKDSWGGSF